MEAAFALDRLARLIYGLGYSASGSMSTTATMDRATLSEVAGPYRNRIQQLLL